MAITFVQFDTAPDIKAVLHREDEPTVPLDLTGCTVRFQMRKKDDKRYTVNASATIVAPASGQVKYSWGASDLQHAGEYIVQWEVTFPGGLVQTTAPEDVVNVRRQ